MADVLTREQRARCMSANRGRDTKPELKLRKSLWHKGYRYRVKNQLPGKPDIIFPIEKVAVFVDGCFWHGCPDHFQMPATNAEFWRKKIVANTERDNLASTALEVAGWYVVRYWEHDIRSDVERCATQIINKLLDRRG